MNMKKQVIVNQTKLNSANSPVNKDDKIRVHVTNWAITKIMNYF